VDLKNRLRDIQTDCRNLLHDLAPPNRGGLNSTHIYGTHVPVEEPSTASIAEVSLHRGERRSGPKGYRLALSERLGSDEDPDWGNIVRVPSGSAHTRRPRYFLGVVCREMLVPSRCREIPMA